MPAQAGALASAETGVSVRIHLPDVALQSFATFYYFVECEGELEDFLYPEWGNLRFTLAGTWDVGSRETRAEMPRVGALFGPTDCAFPVAGRRGRSAGFGMTPLGWERLIGTPAVELANRIVDVGDRFGPEGNALRDVLAAHGSDAEGVALFDRLIAERLAARPPNSALAIAVDGALRDRPRDVAAFAAAAGVSDRTLGRVCKQVFGFGPKRLLRRQRFLDTLGRIRVTEEVRFGDLRDEAYFDQSHFNHEFHEFMGLSPTEYLSVPRPLMGRAALVQLQAGIPLSFKLPPPPCEGPAPIRSA